MGFAESYTLGEINCSDLTAFFKVFIANRKCLSTGTNWTSVISARFGTFMSKSNNLANARPYIAAHYDISNEMFAAFLSPDMTYSCPISLPRSNPRAEETLEQAQYRELAHIMSNARIRSSAHFLEIGTGWGSFAILAVEETGCRVTTITLSNEQKALAEERIKAAGYGDKIKVLLCDYRSIPVPADEQDKYDKIVSIEMLKAVGAKHLSTYLLRRLTKTLGVAIVTVGREGAVQITYDMQLQGQRRCRFRVTLWSAKDCGCKRQDVESEQHKHCRETS